MKFTGLLFLLAMLISTGSFAILQNAHTANQGKQRKLGWFEDNLTGNNLKLAGASAGAAGIASFMYSKPSKDVKLQQDKYARRLKYEQTLYGTRQTLNTQIGSEIEEMVKASELRLNDFQKEAVNRIQQLRSDIELKFKEYGQKQRVE